MVLIDFTDEEIRHILHHYTPDHHPQIWSKLMRAMIPKHKLEDDWIWNLDKEEFDERLRRASKIVGMDMMKNMAQVTSPPPPTYPEYYKEIASIRSEIREINLKLQSLSKSIAELKIYGKKWTDK